MISQKNTGVAERALKTIWNGPHDSVEGSLFAEGFVFRNLSSVNDVTDLDGLRQRAASVRATYPCGRLKVQDRVDSGNWVSVWWTFRDRAGCRSERASRGLQHKLMDGTCMFRVQDGRVAEMWELGGQLVGVF